MFFCYICILLSACCPSCLVINDKHAINDEVTTTVTDYNVLTTVINEKGIRSLFLNVAHGIDFVFITVHDSWGIQIISETIFFFVSENTVLGVWCAISFFFILLLNAGVL